MQYAAGNLNPHHMRLKVLEGLAMPTRDQDPHESSFVETPSIESSPRFEDGDFMSKVLQLLRSILAA